MWAKRTARLSGAVVVILLGGRALRAEEDFRPADFDPPDTLPPVFFFPTPNVTTLVEIAPFFATGAITDIEPADFDGDGVIDLAVAWFATGNLPDPTERLRRLTILRGDAMGGFAPLLDFNLHVPDPTFPDDSFRYSFVYGTSELASGDFDGDGDLDLAALPFYGDEVWFIENLGGGQFTGYLKFMFGFNSAGFPTTPPRAASADFDGDGRDDLVYVADVTGHWDSHLLHFWRTDDVVANMQRILWGPDAGAIYVNFTRSLAVADFDADGRPDVAFSGASSPAGESDPVFVVWHDLNLTTRKFSVLNVPAGLLISDMLAIPAANTCPPHVVLADLALGDRIEAWSNDCNAPPSFSTVGQLNEFAGLSPDRGITLAAADVNGDGLVDLVAKQRTGTPDDANQIQVALATDSDGRFALVDDSVVDTTGQESDSSGDEILRPNTLAVADLFGNRRPEIIAAFRPTFAAGAPNRLELTIWPNGCFADVNQDGVVDLSDLTLLLEALPCGCTDEVPPDVDLNRDGVVDLQDLHLLLADMDCEAPEHVVTLPQ